MMPIESLWAPVRTVPSFVDAVRDSIEETGLHNPIIVVRLPREDAVQHFQTMKRATYSKRDHPPEKLDPPHGFPETPVVNIIWGGSNRLDAIKQLGYTHVDCVLIPDFHVAMQIQEKQRNAYSAHLSGGSDGSAGV